MIKFAVDLPVKFAFQTFENVSVSEEKTAYNKLVKCGQQFHDKYLDSSIGQIDGVQHARQFFRAIGVDPTKRRPSSEALLNRALKNKGFFSVNTLVDVGNWCSLDFLLPICIYDLDKVSGKCTIRLGQENESYEALNNNDINLHNRFLIADEIGAFGSPITDSKRTAVSPNTTKTLVGIWAPADFPSKQLDDCSTIFADRIINICGGIQILNKILP